MKYIYFITSFFLFFLILIVFGSKYRPISRGQHLDFIYSKMLAKQKIFLKYQDMEITFEELHRSSAEVRQLAQEYVLLAQALFVKNRIHSKGTIEIDVDDQDIFYTFYNRVDEIKNLTNNKNIKIHSKKKNFSVKINKIEQIFDPYIIKDFNLAALATSYYIKSTSQGLDILREKFKLKEIDRKTLLFLGLKRPHFQFQQDQASFFKIGEGSIKLKVYSPPQCAFCKPLFQLLKKKLLFNKDLQISYIPVFHQYEEKQKILVESFYCLREIQPHLFFDFFEALQSPLDLTTIDNFLESFVKARSIDYSTYFNCRAKKKYGEYSNYHAAHTDYAQINSFPLVNIEGFVFAGSLSQAELDYSVELVSEELEALFITKILSYYHSF